MNSFLHKMLLKDIMTTPVVFIYEDDPFSKVEELFLDNKIRHLPVVNDSKQLVGVITQRDLYRILSPRKVITDALEYRKDIFIEREGYYFKDMLDSYILKHLMHHNPSALKEDNTLGDAVHLMASKKIGCIPIIEDNGCVCGIVTQHDILKLIDKVYMNS